METADKVERLFFRPKTGFSTEIKSELSDFVAAAAGELGSHALHRRMKQRNAFREPMIGAGDVVKRVSSGRRRRRRWLVVVDLRVRCSQKHIGLLWISHPMRRWRRGPTEDGGKKNQQ
jgi:hypothetical protein